LTTALLKEASVGVEGEMTRFGKKDGSLVSDTLEAALIQIGRRGIDDTTAQGVSAEMPSRTFGVCV